MLDNFIGSDVFYEGVTAYLKRYAFHNAETVDLFNILQESVGNRINLKAIMDTWTRQMGFPVVSVAVKTKTSYTLSQKRFLADPEAQFNASESKFGYEKPIYRVCMYQINKIQNQSFYSNHYRYKWTIPITYITSENSTPTLVWFDKDATNCNNCYII